MIESIRITLKPDTELEPLDLTIILKAVTYDGEYTSREPLMIARCLLKGEGWEPPVSALLLDQVRFHSLNGPFKLEVKDFEDETRAAYRESAERARIHRDLLERGATGDVDAAIEYCRLELAGKINHAACG